MSLLFARLLKTRRVLPPPWTGLQQRAAYIKAKPPKDKIGALQSVFVLAVMSVTILGPSGWILSHLEEYKQASS